MDGRNLIELLRLQVRYTAAFDARDVPKRCATMGYCCFSLAFFGDGAAALGLALAFLALEILAYGLRCTLPHADQNIPDWAVVAILARVLLAVMIFASGAVLLALQPQIAAAIVGLIFLSGVAVHAIIAHTFLPLMNWLIVPPLSLAILSCGYLVSTREKTLITPDETWVVFISGLVWIVALVMTVARQTSTRKVYSHALRTAKERADRLDHLSRHDALTGLLNRAAFHEVLLDALQFAHPKAQIAIILLDLDKFKPINDTYGHAAGDRALVEIAARITEVLGKGHAARLGGDEFVGLILDAQDRDRIEAILDHLRTRLADPIKFGGHRLEIGASIGVTIAETPDANPSALLGRADSAMYVAKARNCSVPLFAEDLAETG